MLLTPIFKMNIDAKYIIQHAEHFDKGRAASAVAARKIVRLKDVFSPLRQYT